MGIMPFLAAVALASGAPQPPDHRDPTCSPSELMRAAFRAADAAELLASQANYCVHGVGNQLARSADRLHLALSDLYRAARREARGGNLPPPDHREGEYAELFEIIEVDYQAVQNDFSRYGYACSRSAQQTYQTLQYDYAYLEQLFDPE